jgi:hypothetical protein
MLKNLVRPKLPRSAVNSRGIIFAGGFETFAMSSKTYWAENV